MTKWNFSRAERGILLAVKGVGPKVIARLEELGIVTLRQLATQDAESVCSAASILFGSTCWKNSPQARSAIAPAIAAAQSAVVSKMQRIDAQPDAVGKERGARVAVESQEPSP